MNKQLFERYAQLKIKEKELKGEMDEIRPQVVSEIEAAEIDKVVIPGYGSVGFKIAKIWKFSHAVEQAELEIEGLKDKEKNEGKATFTERKDLVFNAEKK